MSRTVLFQLRDFLKVVLMHHQQWVIFKTKSNKRKFLDQFISETFRNIVTCNTSFLENNGSFQILRTRFLTAVACKNHPK